MCGIDNIGCGMTSRVHFDMFRGLKEVLVQEGLHVSEKRLMQPSFIIFFPRSHAI